MVEAVFLTFSEDAQPGFNVGRWIAGFGEAAVFHCAAQPDRTSVHIELSAFYADFAHAEGDGNFDALIFDRSCIESGIEFVPRFYFMSHLEMEGLLVDLNIYRMVSQMR